MVPLAGKNKASPAHASPCARGLRLVPCETDAADAAVKSAIRTLCTKPMWENWEHSSQKIFDNSGSKKSIFNKSINVSTCLQGAAGTLNQQNMLVIFG